MPRIGTRARRLNRGSADDARRALGLVSAGLRTVAGKDEEPSALWAALAVIPGVNPDGWELAQDVLLMCAAICDGIADNIETPNRIPWTLTSTVGEWMPEIIEDGEKLKP